MGKKVKGRLYVWVFGLEKLKWEGLFGCILIEKERRRFYIECV